ncbi:MAG: peroxiredoxin [Nanoarchaeota archaeon]|nr:peroxiredoxin [Nanoarchaeota archaeon]MBU0977696.1 peroxiredoxin [Nanoarchaeota archaeon]
MKVGDQITDFEFNAYHKGNFTKGKLSDYKGKWIVLFFYPEDFTFVCPTEIRAFAKHHKDFEKEGAAIVGASTDSVHSHKAWFERDLPEVKFPVISDSTHKISEQFNVLQEDGTALRGTFIISPDQILKYTVVSDNNVGRSVEETLRVLKALKTGELCPIEWKPGEKTLGA